MKSNPKKYIRNKKKITNYRGRTESSHKTEKHSTRGKHHTSSDDKKVALETVKYLLDLYNII